MQYVALTFLFILSLISATLQGQNISLKGEVQDMDGEKLSFANVLVLPDSAIAPADAKGNFSIKVVPGNKNIIISYAGYEVFRSEISLQKDTTILFKVSGQIGQLDEVTINAGRYSQRMLIQSARTGTTTLTQEEINAIPVLGGEADIIKTLQLLPGTSQGVEGSADLFVRGGAADQNLVLLDGASIYNTSHLFGFLSVFNPDILEKVEAINGGFPAEYGGRLSAILDITSRNSIAEKTHVSGNVGLIASRLFIEQPLLKDKASIWVAGRRTYIDQVAKAVGEELPYFFYDLNGKAMFKPGKHNQLEFSYYGGEDIFDLYRDRNDDGRGFRTLYASGNNSQSMQWRHQYSNGWESDLTLIRSSFQYDINNSFEENKLLAFSNIEDYGAKISLKKDSVGNEGGINLGFEWTRHDVSPNVISSEGGLFDFPEKSATSGRIVHEMAAHIQQDWLLSDRLLISTGFRGSLALLGDKKYFTPEPRISIRYALAEEQSVKLSYSRMAQYIHRVSNSAISLPTDIWYPVTDSIRPQKSHQFAVAWQKFFPKPHIFISMEAYYKDMRNLIDYEQGTNLFLNADFRSKLIQGMGRAYGLEFLLHKEAGKFTGWLSYTLSWSRRKYNEINDGDWFFARYDRRHNGALVLQYQFHHRWALSMVWEYISGARFTPIIGQYVVPSPTLTGIDLLPIYSDINEVKLADTHRLDLGIKYKSKPGKKFQWEWFVGVNNVYNRANPIGITIEQDETDGSLKYIQPGLFGLLPFISYQFEF